jgi:hypothetical protein
MATSAEPPDPNVKPIVIEGDFQGQGESEPYRGWSYGRRAPIYVNMMMTAGAFGEDASNRFTTRDSTILEGVGGIFRIGAVLGPRHRLGARMQSFFGPTKRIMRDPELGTTNNKWGAVTLGYFGPEYIYDTGFGFYVGGSIGLAVARSKRDLDNKDEGTTFCVGVAVCVPVMYTGAPSDTERSSLGLAGMLSLGYEWRMNKWFAINTETYGGLYRSVDDTDDSMTGSLFGLAMGVGF